MAESVGYQIKRYRTDKGWNLTQLATETGLSKSYLSELETISDATKRPSGQTLYGIATALGVTIADLLGEAVAPAPTTERPGEPAQIRPPKAVARGRRRDARQHPLPRGSARNARAVGIHL